jgi:hypothetical protein
LPAAAATGLVGLCWASTIRPILHTSRGEPRWLGFLERHVGREDVVLTDVETCWYVPSFGGHVVAYPMHLPFVPDHAERVRAVERFFAPGVARRERVELIRRYGARYVLLDKERFDDWRPRLAELRTLGRSVYSSPEYELLRITASVTAADRHAGPGAAR